MPKDLVAILSVDETLSDTRRNVTIGTSIGLAALLIILMAIIFAVRRKQRRRSHCSNRVVDPYNHPQQPEELKFSKTPKEIDENSMVGPFRELPSSGKVELLDETSPSGSGKAILEMSRALPLVAHELRTHRSSRVMLQNHPANIGKIFMSTQISRKSWTSLASSDGTPSVQTVIAASAKHEQLDVDAASVATSNLEAEIYCSYLRKPIDLERSLPPTPISESPQVSPVAIKFDNGSSFQQRPHFTKVQTRGSMSAFVSPEMPISRYSTAYKRAKRLPVGNFSDVVAHSKKMNNISRRASKSLRHRELLTGAVSSE